MTLLLIGLDDQYMDTDLETLNNSSNYYKKNLNQKIKSAFGENFSVKSKGHLDALSEMCGVNFIIKNLTSNENKYLSKIYGKTLYFVNKGNEYGLVLKSNKKSLKAELTDGTLSAFEKLNLEGGVGKDVYLMEGGPAEVKVITSSPLIKPNQRPPNQRPPNQRPLPPLTRKTPNTRNIQGFTRQHSRRSPVRRRNVTYEKKLQEEAAAKAEAERIAAEAAAKAEAERIAAEAAAKAEAERIAAAAAAAAKAEAERVAAAEAAAAAKAEGGEGSSREAAAAAAAAKAEAERVAAAAAAAAKAEAERAVAAAEAAETTMNMNTNQAAAEAAAKAEAEEPLKQQKQQ